MLHVKTVPSDEQVWLNFVDLNGIPAAGIQRPQNSPSETPFNFFWWGFTRPQELVGFFSELVANEVFCQPDHSFVRVAQHGSETKIEFVDTQKLICQPSEVLHPMPDLALMRLELHLNPENISHVDVKMKSSQLIVWARPNEEPNVSDPEEGENIGIYIQPSFFFTNKDFIEKFVEKTSRRPIHPSGFHIVVSGIQAAIAGL